MSARLESLSLELGYSGGPSARLAQALTHRSYANEAATGSHNERLEFLGDAVVGLLVAEALMEALPSVAEGTLSRLRASIVNARTLAELARARGLGQILRLGRGEMRTGGREKDSLLADAYEAMVGAVYLDLGLEHARRLVRTDTASRISAGESSANARDHKTQLQEWVQARLQSTPLYRLIEAEGPDHDKTFTVEVVIEGAVTCRGTGRSKKAAERLAAEAAWEELTRTGQIMLRREDAEAAPAPAGSGSPSPASPPEGS